MATFDDVGARVITGNLHPDHSTLARFMSHHDQRWEQEFAAYRTEHELDLSGGPAEVVRYLKGVPALSKLCVAERVATIGGVLAWLAVFVLLGIAELRGLVWLANGAQPGNSGLATFSVVAIACAMAAPIVAPTLYFTPGPACAAAGFHAAGLEGDARAQAQRHQRTRVRQAAPF